MDGAQEGVYLGGKAELAIGKAVIGPQFLQDITVDFEEGEQSVESLAGTVTNPSGMMSTAQLTGNFILPSMDALKVLFQEAYEAPTAEGLAGRVVFGTNSCTTKVPLPINVHYVCEPNSDNDFHIYAGLVKADFNSTYNQSDKLVLPFTIYAQPTSKGYGHAGAGDLSKKTLWDASTGSWVDVPASEPAAASTKTSK